MILYIVHKEIAIGRLSIVLDWRSKKSFMGRFGGGWNWKLGFQASGRSFILSLLVLDIVFRYRAKETESPA